MSLLYFSPTEHPCLQNHATSLKKKMNDILTSQRKQVSTGGWIFCTVRKPFCQHTTQVKHARPKA